MCVLSVVCVRDHFIRICSANQLTNEKTPVVAGTKTSRFLSKTRQGVRKGEFWESNARARVCVVSFVH